MRIFPFILASLILSLFPSDVFAASISTSIVNPNETYQPSHEIQVNTVLDITADEGTVYYLRGVFYKEGTTNYCGLTWNGGDWFSGPYTNGGHKSFLKATITNNKWEGIVKFKIDTTDTGCNNSSNYKFKIQRFTENSSSPQTDDQNELTFSFAIPTATSIPTSTPVPTNSPTPTKAPTSTPQPSNTPAPTATPIKSPSPTIKKTLSPTLAIQALAAKTSPKPTSKSTVGIKDGSENSSIGKVMGSSNMAVNDEMPGIPEGTMSYNWGKLFLIIGGVVAVCGIGYLVYSNYRVEKADEL